MSILDFTEMRRIVEDTLKTSFTSCSIQFENVTLNKSDLTEWVAVFDAQSFSDSTGFKEVAAYTKGVVIIAIFTPLNTGTERSRQLAEDLSTILANKNIEGVQFDTPELHNAAPNETWFQQNLHVPYSVVLGQDSTY